MEGRFVTKHSTSLHVILLGLKCWLNAIIINDSVPRLYVAATTAGLTTLLLFLMPQIGPSHLIWKTLRRLMIHFKKRPEL